MAATAEFYNLHAGYVTMIIDNSTITYDGTKQFGSDQVGKAVEMSGEATVKLVQSGNEIFGKLIEVTADLFCTIQDEGYCDLPCDGSPAYTENDNGLVGGSTAGNVTKATAVPAAGAVRRAHAIKSDGSGRLIAKLC